MKPNLFIYEDLGAWGIALFALFAVCGGELEAFLGEVFKDIESVPLSASEKEQVNFVAFMEKYPKGLAVVRLAAEGIVGNRL